MDDIEKNRATYVQQIETKISHLQNECEKYKAIADKWEPKLTMKTDVKSGNVTFGLQFGGKFVHASVTQQWLLQVDETSATTSIVDALVESLVVSELRKIVAPEVDKAQRAAKSISTAGKW